VTPGQLDHVADVRLIDAERGGAARHPMGSREGGMGTVDPQRCVHPYSGTLGGDGEPLQFQCAFDVHRRFGLDGGGQLGVRLGRSAEDDLLGRTQAGAGDTGQRELATRGDVETIDDTRESVKHIRMAIGLHGVKQSGAGR
jgi:hypothetical protein